MNNTNEREDLIAELLRSADLLQIGKVEDWDGLAAEILQAVEMLKADLQDFETYSKIIKSSTAREQHTRETLHKVLAGIQTQQLTVPSWKAEQIDEFEIRVTSPEGESWRLRSADRNDIFNNFIWRWAQAMIKGEIK